MTNFERIKNMSVEDFAKILFSSCTEEIDGNASCYQCKNKVCEECVIDWLNSECEVVE